MRNHRLALTMTAALATGCSGQQSDIKNPATPVVSILAGSKGETVNEKPEENNEDIQQSPEQDIQDITEAMRNKLFSNSRCGSKIWEICEGEVTSLFFKLAEKVPTSEDIRCRADGDYEPGCIEEVYRNYFGEDTLYTKYKQKDHSCIVQRKLCITEAEASCNDQCWQNIREELKQKKHAN